MISLKEAMEYDSPFTFISIWVNFIFLCIAMYNKSISKSRFFKILPIFADELLMTSLQIFVYLGVIMVSFTWCLTHYNGAVN